MKYIHVCKASTITSKCLTRYMHTVSSSFSQFPAPNHTKLQEKYRRYDNQGELCVSESLSM